MVETHLAKAEGAGGVGDELVAEAELPRGGQAFIAGGSEGGAALGGGLVELLEGVLAGGEVECHVRAGGVGHVHAVVFEDVVAEHEDGGAVHGEFAERHGLVVTLPVVLAFGDAFERAAGVGDFGVVVLEEDLGDGHLVFFLSFNFNHSHDQYEKLNRLDIGIRCILFGQYFPSQLCEGLPRLPFDASVSSHNAAQ